MGSTIYGKQAVEGFGKSVALSNDGMVLTVGAPDKRDSRGAIRVYMYDEEADMWNQVGTAIEGDAPYDYWGSTVATSGDGRTVVSGGNNYLGTHVGEAHVRVYRGT